jgi:hypothetical protein
LPLAGGELENLNHKKGGLKMEKMTEEEYYILKLEDNKWGIRGCKPKEIKLCDLIEAGQTESILGCEQACCTQIKNIEGGVFEDMLSTVSPKKIETDELNWQDLYELAENRKDLAEFILEKNNIKLTKENINKTLKNIKEYEDNECYCESLDGWEDYDGSNWNHMLLNNESINNEDYLTDKSTAKIYSLEKDENVVKRILKEYWEDIEWEDENEGSTTGKSKNYKFYKSNWDDDPWLAIVESE